MDYNLEALGDERFQKLCQAILTDIFPNVQCLPVAQPDGGRDAFVTHPNGFIVFQVKYSRNPQAKDARISISELISSEKHKVDILIKRGATAYYLMTNVTGTSHPDVGSIDKVNEELTKAFGIPSYCWWRDDIERRVETSTGLIWRYPEIFRGSDFLEILVSGKTGSIAPSKAGTFRSYVAAQYSKESEVKFQQVQIQSSLFDLFTDTPIGVAREKIPSMDISRVPEISIRRLRSSSHAYMYDHPSQTGMETLAVNWLISAAPEAGLQRIVLEGAPGQGKSTVTQYLAQLHRMRNLCKIEEYQDKPDRALNGFVRIPLRVDLRDYANWLIGNDPFANEKDVKRPISALDSLESFLSHQIYTLSGGRDFAVSDLISTLEDAHCLLVLDGFDEVADKGTRARLIDQIRLASDRLDEAARSMQIIVTSRPAAFILSSGFPEREWLHLSLLPMRLAQISSYSDKWVVARGLSPTQSREFKELLLDRVNRPHIRSLAQNPMQLAILLNLISTKGRSLPDKRTALYDSYMDLFFGREAEKDETVRENRDVLIQIHQYVAWNLQLDAELPGGSGSISQSELEALVRRYLHEKEHQGDVLKLFTGVVERVGALVSRVQGMLEFEVQPLREYFTGRFLYETAPYSPPGAEKGGTRPQRFDALARRPYWLNVARFYAGCYNSGELSSLVAGMEQLDEEVGTGIGAHVLQLAILFLNDWVFSQEPKSVKDVVSFISEERNARLIIADRASWEDGRLSLPEKSGRTEFAARLKSLFLSASETSYMARLGLAIRLNTTLNERWDMWTNLRKEGVSALRQADYLGLFVDSNEEMRNPLIKAYGNDARNAFVLAGRWDYIGEDDRISIVDPTSNRNMSFRVPQMGGLPPENSIALYRVYLMLHPHIYRFISYDHDGASSLSESLSRYGINIDSNPNPTSLGEVHALPDIVEAAFRTSRLPIEQWRTTLEPWSDFIESARRTWGDCAGIYCLAAVAAGVRSKSAKAEGFNNLLDHKLPLVERVRYARLKTAGGWWQDQIAACQSDQDTFFLLIVILSWAPSAVLKLVSKDLEGLLEAISASNWGELLNLVRAVVSATDARQPLSSFSEEDISMISSVRLQIMLSLRVRRASSSWIILNLIENYDGSDLHIRLFLADMALRETHSDGRVWKTVLAFFESNPDLPSNDDVDAVISRGGYFYGSRGNMASAMSNHILANQERLPLSLVETALLSRSHRDGAAKGGLGEVAVSQQWFN